MSEEKQLLDANGDPIKFGKPGADHDFWYEEFPFLGSVSPIVSPRTVQQLATVYACVDALAKTVAMLPCLLKSLNGGRQVDAVDHPLYKVLRKRPNPNMDSFQFWQLQQRTMLLRGNFYARVIRGRNGGVTALYPINPDVVHVEFNAETNELEYFIYNKLEKRWVFLPQREIFHTREPGDDGIIGQSRIKTAAMTMQLGLQFLEHNTSFFKNDSRPAGMLIPEVPLKKDEAKEELRQSWEKMHKGPKNAGRVAVLPFGVKYEQISISPKDAQLLELMQFTTLDQICTLFDVPPYRIQDFRNATFSNIEHTSINWGKNSIQPRVVSTELAIDTQLLRDELAADRNHEAKFNMDSIFRADLLTRTQAHGMAIKDGWQTRNEVRQDEGLNPADEQLDKFLVPLNMTTPDLLEQQQQEPAPQPPPALQRQPLTVREQLSMPLRKLLARIVRAEERFVWKAHETGEPLEKLGYKYDELTKDLSASLLSVVAAYDLKEVYSAEYCERFAFHFCKEQCLKLGDSKPGKHIDCDIWATINDFIDGVSDGKDSTV